MTQQQLMNDLEDMIDNSSLENVLMSIARLCNEKAEHLRVNWQDEPTALDWDRRATELDRLVSSGVLE